MATRQFANLAHGHINSWMHPVRIQLIHSAKACSCAAYTGSGTGTVFDCTDDSDNVDSIFVVPASCEEKDAATEGLLPINQATTEQSMERAIEKSEQSIDRAQEYITYRRLLKSYQVG
jgi:hypothetical protein